MKGRLQSGTLAVTLPSTENSTVWRFLLWQGRSQGKASHQRPGSTDMVTSHGSWPLSYFFLVSHWSRLKGRVFMLSRAAWLSERLLRASFLAASVDVRSRAGKDAGQWPSPCEPKTLWDFWFLGSRCTSTPSAFWKCSPGWPDVRQRLGRITGLRSHP